MYGQRIVKKWIIFRDVRQRWYKCKNRQRDCYTFPADIYDAIEIGEWPLIQDA